MPDFNMSVISIAPTLRKEIAGMTVDVTLAVDLNSGVQSASISDSISTGKALTDAGFVAVHTDVPAIGAQTSAYARAYSNEQELKVSGMGLDLSVLANRKISEGTKLVIGVGYQTEPLSGSGDFSWVDNRTQDGVGGIVVKETTDGNVKYDETDTTISVLAGIEKNISDELLFGAGLLLAKNTETIEYKILDSKNTNVAAATVVTYNGADELTRETKTTNISLPVGIEWKPLSWLRVRFGNSYTITYETVTNEHVKTSVVGATDVVTDVMTTKKTVAIAPTVEAEAFYSGIGFLIGENLVIDVTNVAAGNILDLSNWELGAVLKF